MSDDFTLRTPPGVGNEAPPLEGGGLRRGEVPGVNATAELLADLLAASGLVPEDKLALARGRAGASGSLAQGTPRALPPEGVDLYAVLRELEDRLIREALERSGGNRKQAAKILGLSRQTLRQRLRNIGRGVVKSFDRQPT